MFFYVFFLRPPPTRISPGSLVTFTPQIANDLRTEDFAGEQDIYYSWSLVSPTAEPYPTITPPQKLTTWRASNFKEFSIPLPPRARDGQSYRLVLTTRQHGRAHILNLAAREVGEKPCPVLSMPIQLSARAARAQGHGNVEKQQQIERVYRVPLSPENNTRDGFLMIREQTSFDLDKKVWDSGVGLSSWLVELAHERPPHGTRPALVTRVHESLFSSNGCRIIELGAGTGIVSLTLGALLSARPRAKDGCIFTTDLESALPLLDHNIRTNAALFTSPSTRPQPLALDWDNPLPEEVQAMQNGFDVIIMADVTYNTTSFPALVQTLTSLIHLNPPERPPLVVMGYKERDPEERTLWDLLKGIGIVLERIGERQGAGKEPVEIWIGRRGTEVPS